MQSREDGWVEEHNGSEEEDKDGGKERQRVV